MSETIPSSTASHRLVRVQDDLHGLRLDTDGVFLPNAMDRNTVHFAFDGVVTDHAYGSFNSAADGSLKGKIVIVANPAEMAIPSGLNQVDTWFRKETRTNPSTGEPERGIGVGAASVIAPVGTAPVEGVQMVFYDGTPEDRDRKVTEVLVSAGVQRQEIGFRSWTSTTTDWSMNASLDWSKKTAAELYGSSASSIHTGMHDSSPDDLLDMRANAIRYQLSELKSGDHLHFDSAQMCDVPRIDTIRGLVSKQMSLLDEVAGGLPSSEHARCGDFFDRMRSETAEVSAAAEAIEEKRRASVQDEALRSRIDALPGDGPIYLSKPGTQAYQPFTNDEFAAAVLSNSLDPEDRLWRSGLHAEWRPVNEVLPGAVKLAALNNNLPPMPAFQDIREVAARSRSDIAGEQSYAAGRLKPLLSTDSEAKSGPRLGL